LPCGGCKTESLKKAQHEKIENVAGSVWFSLFMDLKGYWKVQVTVHAP
jgi:hypothetical protein